MALSAHELILILRARDEASRVLRSVRDEFPKMQAGMSAMERQSVRDEQARIRAAQAAYAQGQALTTIGVAAAASGIAMMKGFNDAANAAAEYNNSVALTQTQLDGVRWASDNTLVGFDDLSRMGRQLGATLPVEFGQIQGAMYDIFSSMETTGEGATIVLDSIGRAAIAGKVDMETAGRSIIAVMNAWGLKAEDTGKINDTMFQLVRKGVGTYDEFGKSIGKAIPSAVKAGQSFEDLGGMMAFLTRNGISTAMSSTTAARALDALANPKTVSKFKELGINVLDGNGNFRDMSTIMGELRGKFEGMSESAKAAKLQELFKGSGGTIQAMRFFNLAVNDTNGLLQTLTADMYNAAGATQEAFDIMSQTPEARLQMLNNQFELFKIAVGDAILPLKMAIVDTFSTMLSWFNNLDPGIQRVITNIGVFIAVLLTVSGIVMAIVGVVLMMKAALVLAGGTFIGLAAPILGVVAVVAALIAIGWLVIANWDAIKAAATGIWDTFIAGIQPALDVFNFFAQAINGWWQNTIPALQNAFNNIVQSLQVFGDIFMSFVGPAVQGFMGILGNMQGTLTVLGAVFAFVWAAITMAVQIVIGVFVMLGTVVANIFGGIIAGLGMFVSGIIMSVTGFFQILEGIFTGNWSLIVQGVMNILNGFLSAVGGIFGALVGAVVGFIKGLVEGVINFFKYLYDVIVGNSIVPDMVEGIIEWIAKLPGEVFSFISNMVTQAIAKFNEWKTNAMARAGELVSNVVNAISKMPGQIISFIVNLVSQFLSQVAMWHSNTVSKVSALVVGVVSQAATLPGKVIAAVVALAGMLSSQGTAWFNSLRSAVSSGISNVMGLVSSLPGRIVGAVSGIAGQMAGIGSNIMSSLAGGIRNAIGGVVNAAISAGRAVLDGAKRALGIASPSKEMFAIGGFGVEGLKNALLAGRRIIGRAGEKLAGAASKSVAFGMSEFDDIDVRGPRPGPGPAPGGITQNFEIYTQEIDPVKHGADLGFEIAGRLGF